jgi:hypothetical protein
MITAALRPYMVTAVRGLIVPRSESPAGMSESHVTATACHDDSEAGMRGRCIFAVPKSRPGPVVFPAINQHHEQLVSVLLALGDELAVQQCSAAVQQCSAAVQQCSVAVAV